MSQEVIRVEHLKKAYEDVTPITDLSTVINKGDVIAVIGPSGTGKSTFMRCLNLLEQPTEGKIFIAGDEITAPDADVTAIRRKMGMVFQGFNLFPHLSVLENVMMAPMDQLGLSKQEAYDKAMKLLNDVGMADKAYAYPGTLSGGQKQRVAIARALAMDPEILLLDEPTSALDPARVEEVMAVVYRLAQKGMTMILVTHEMSFARNTANRIFYMDEGGIYEEGKPEEIFEHPQKEKTKLFIYSQHMTSFTVNAADFDYFEALGFLALHCRKNNIQQKLQKKVQLLLEELINESILPKLREDAKQTPSFDFKFFCEGQEKVIVTVSYPDIFGNLLEPENEISASILQKLPQELKTSENDGKKTLSMVIGI